MDFAATVPPDMQTRQTMPDVSPTKWHLAHTSWFFETFILKPHHAGYVPFDPDFEYLFNSYYNGVGAQYPRDRRGEMDEPVLDVVHAYRAHIDAAMTAFLDSGVLDDIPDHRVAASGGTNNDQRLRRQVDMLFILHVIRGNGFIA